jgi:hypothetical protein
MGREPQDPKREGRLAQLVPFNASSPVPLHSSACFSLHADSPSSRSDLKPLHAERGILARRRPGRILDALAS